MLTFVFIVSEEYRVFLEKLSFSSKLMEAARCTSKLVHRSSKFKTSDRSSQNPIGRPAPKRSPTSAEKKPIFMALNNDKEVTSGLKIRNRGYLVLPPFLCDAKKPPPI